MSLNDNGPCRSDQRTYAALKEQILERRCSPGTRLKTAAIAQTLSADQDATLSALIVLAIEKLIDYRPGEGFFTKIPSERECHSLYLYNGALLIASLREAVRQAAIVQRAQNEWIDPRTNAESDDGEAAARFAETLFIAIGRLSGNTIILEAIIETNARLHAFRRSEAAVFEDCCESLIAMRKFLEAGWFLELIATIETYHRRRADHVAEIIRAGTTGSSDEVAFLGKVAPSPSTANRNEHADNRHARDR